MCVALSYNQGLSKRERSVIICPNCSSQRTLIHVDAGRRARCLQCGAGWVQDGAWQRSVSRPTPTSPSRVEPILSTEMEVPPGVSGLDMALAVVGELQRGHGAVVTGHDVVGGVPEISLRLKVPLSQRFDA